MYWSSKADTKMANLIQMSAIGGLTTAPPPLPNSDQHLHTVHWGTDHSTTTPTWFRSTPPHCSTIRGCRPEHQWHHEPAFSDLHWLASDLAFVGVEVEWSYWTNKKRERQTEKANHTFWKDPPETFIQQATSSTKSFSSRTHCYLHPLKQSHSWLCRLPLLRSLHTYACWRCSHVTLKEPPGRTHHQPQTAKTVWLLTLTVNSKSTRRVTHHGKTQVIKTQIKVCFSHYTSMWLKRVEKNMNLSEWRRLSPW